MKKFLALLLALIMCMTMFAACKSGEDKDSDKDDDNAEAIEELEKEIEELKEELEDEDDEDKIKKLEEKIEKKEKELKELKSSSKDKDDEDEEADDKGGDLLGFFSDLRKFKATATIDSIEELESYADVFGDNFPEMIDAEDVEAEFYLDADKGKIALLGSAKLDGDKHEIGFYMDGDAMILESDAIDETSGMEVEYSFDNLSEAFAMINKFSAGELDDYATVLCDILVEEADADDDEDGDGNRVVAFEADTDALIAVGEALMEVFKEDGFDEYTDPVALDIVYISREYKWYTEDGEDFPYEYFYNGEIVIDEDGNLVGIDTDFGYTRTDYDGESYGRKETAKYEYDVDSGKFEYTTDVTWFENGESDGDIYKSSVTGTVGEKYEIKSYNEWESTVWDEDYENSYGEAPRISEGAATVKIDSGKISLDVKSTYTYSVYDGGIVEKTDENETAISAKYSISGDKLTLTPLTFKYMDIEIEDIDKDFGLELKVEKGEKVPSFPDYEEYDNWSDFNDDVLDPLYDEYEYIIDFLSNLVNCFGDRAD